MAGSGLSPMLIPPRTLKPSDTSETAPLVAQPLRLCGNPLCGDCPARPLSSQGLSLRPFLPPSSLCCAPLPSQLPPSPGAWRPSTDYKFHQVPVNLESDSSLIRGPDSLYLSRANYLPSAPLSPLSHPPHLPADPPELVGDRELADEKILSGLVV